MSAELAQALGFLLLASIGGLTLLVRLIGIRLQNAINDAVYAARRSEQNSNGKLTALIEENIRLRLELEQMRAIIHSMQK